MYMCGNNNICVYMYCILYCTMCVYIMNNTISTCTCTCVVIIIYVSICVYMYCILYCTMCVYITIVL